MKKLIVLILAVTMILSIAACGAPAVQVAEEETVVEEAAEVTPEPTPEVTPEPTPEPSPEMLTGDINEDGEVVYGLLAYDIDSDSTLFSGTAFEYAGELVGVQTIRKSVDINVYFDNHEKVVGNLMALIDEGADGICFVSAGIAELDEQIAKECSGANIPMVIIGPDSQTGVVANIDYDRAMAGKLLGEYTAQQYPGENAAKIISFKDMLHSQKINEAFDKALEDNGNTIIDEREAHFDPNEAAEDLGDMIKDNGRSDVQFPVLFVENANMLEPDEGMQHSLIILKFVSWAVEEKLDVVCIIENDEGLKLFENGLGTLQNGEYHISYAVANNTGMLEVVSLLALHSYNAGEMQKGTELLLPPVVLDRNNLETLKQASSEPNQAWFGYIKENFPKFESIITKED